jgi:hypothetical protein
MNNEDYSQIAERLGLNGKFIFLYVGSYAADLAMAIKKILELCSVDQLGNNFAVNLSNRLYRK